MPSILGANTLSSGYDVDNSCVFDSATDAHMHITYGSAGNQKKWSWSGWVKRGTHYTTQQNIFSTGTSNVNFVVIYFSTAGKLTYYDATSTATTAFLDTNAQFRDPGAWMHILVSIDTTLSTANNRQRIWVNGTEQTSFANRANYDQNTDTKINGDVKHLLGGSFTGTSNIEFDGHMAEVVFQDGVAHTGAGDFGEFDSTSPTIWKPKDVSGLSFGSNGFYLEFKQTGTSANASGIGADTSGNTNHLTVSAIAATDQSTDTCTNNFCTWNAIAAPYSAPTLSEGNTKVTNNTSQWQGAIGTFGLSQGKWYWEARFDTTTYTYNHGVIDESVNFSDQNPMNANGYTGFYNYDGGEIRYNGGTTSSNYGTFGTNDIIGIALNMDDKQISFYKNGSAIVSNFGLSTTGQTLVFPSTTYYSGGYCSYNFGNASYAISSGNSDADGFGNFEYSVPSGYFALCTKNLAEYG